MDLQALLSNQQIIDQLARSAGVGQGEAKTGLEALLPAVTKGLARNTRGASGLESLAKALGSGSHAQYIDRPETLADPRTRLDGNAILGHIFGSKDVSRNVAGHASESTGIDAALLKQMLPIVASLAMGALNKETNGGDTLRQSSGGVGAGDLLGSLISGLTGGGRNPANDSPLDDVFDLAKKFF